MTVSALDIAISALEKELSRLEASVDALEIWLWVSSIAVAVGVALEIFFLVHKYITDRQGWRQGVISSPARPNIRMLCFEVASVILVLVGVVGELWVGVISSNRNADLRTKNGRLVGLVKQRAAEADERARDADLKRVQLEERIVSIFGPRAFTPEHSARMVRELFALAGSKVDVYVFAVGNPYNATESVETLEFARSTTIVLQSAHLDAEGWLLRSCSGGSASNLVVSVLKRNPEDLRIASRLVQILSIGSSTYPIVDEVSISQGCTEFSEIETSRPNRRPHDANISVMIGRKINPILNREMLEPSKQKEP